MIGIPMNPSTQPAMAIHCQSRSPPVASRNTHATNHTAVPMTTSRGRFTSRGGRGGGGNLTIS
ncbi:hypothetical protein EV186_101482 [Labedaea rhizosphaerae]|uniref:Uncharacterized protein n=1 Tax=Labedaea rhizosphaerae TaxID=598644 RepID=A0A4R6SLV2_LABRH|nr:hypothetical protein EV186_101482 [Labedaea rhizosphaerae]